MQLIRNASHVYCLKGICLEDLYANLDEVLVLNISYAEHLVGNYSASTSYALLVLKLYIINVMCKMGVYI